MNGEAKLRQDKNAKLAELPGVDPTWLYLGVDQNLSPRERKARNAMADGAVNIVAGFIQMDSGNPAFPDEKDVAAKREHIDLYAIIKGANYSIPVSLGVEKNGEWQFPVPTGHEHVAVLGVAREGFCVRIVELTDTVAEAPSNGTRRSRSR